MRPDQAGQLLALLAANYPRTKIGDDTTTLWLEELGKLEYRLGEQAVRSLIASIRVWPSIAHLNEHVEIVRDQRTRAQRDLQRRQANEDFEAMPMPPLKDIPGLLEQLAPFRPELRLPNAGDGSCDDCRADGSRYQVGGRAVCGRCARNRVAAADRLNDAA